MTITTTERVRVPLSETSAQVKRKVPSIEEMRGWPADEFEDRVKDLLEHASEYEIPVDAPSYRQGLEDGLVTAFAAVQRDAEVEGPYVTTVYLTAQNQGLDGATVIERVAELARQ